MQDSRPDPVDAFYRKRMTIRQFCKKHIDIIVTIGVIFTVIGVILTFRSASTPLKPPSHPMDQLSLPLMRAMTPTSATLTGIVVTGTPPTRAWFEVDKNYDSLATGDGAVMPQVVGSPFIREGTYPVVQYIAGLTPNTTYYFRLVVSNDYNAYKASEIEQFTTPSDSARFRGGIK